MSLPRRDFLNVLGTSGLWAAAGIPLPLPIGSLTHREGSAAEAWDMSWVAKINGKFRAVFDSPEISQGAAVFRACIWCDQYKEVLGTPRSDMSPVLVLRHKGIALAMNDEYWDKFDVGKKEKVKDDMTGDWWKKNLVRATQPALPPAFKDYNLEAFMAAGGIVLGCALAFSQVVDQYKKENKLSDDEADRVAKAHLVPGIILQPSGVFAALRAQDAGCHYIIGS